MEKENIKVLISREDSINIFNKKDIIMDNNYIITKKIGQWPTQAKIYASSVFLMIGIGIIFAMVQATVHDVIPTINSFNSQVETEVHVESNNDLGDLLADNVENKNHEPFYQDKKFIFALKFTHIHIFSISGLFFVIGFFVIFFDIRPAFRNALIVLPFIGIIIDLLAVWLKTYLSPYFFFLHIPGGTLFSTVFFLDFVIAFHQMWIKKTT